MSTNMSPDIADATYRGLLDGKLRKDHIHECWGSHERAAEKAKVWAEREAKRLEPYPEGVWQARAMDVYKKMYSTALRDSNDANIEKKNSLLVITVPTNTTQSDEVDELAHRMIIEHVIKSGIYNYRAHSAATITTLEKSIDVFGEMHGSDDPEFLNVYNVWRRSDAVRFIKRMGVHAFKRGGLSVLFIHSALHYRDYSKYGICVAGYMLVEQGQTVNLIDDYIPRYRSTTQTKSGKKRSWDNIETTKERE